LLYSQSPDLFGQENTQKKTPLEVAKHIGEDDAILLIEALLAGEDTSTIGLGKDLDLEEDDTEAPTQSDTSRADAVAPPAAAPAQSVGALEMS